MLCRTAGCMGRGCAGGEASEPVADKLYGTLKGKGARQATYAVQVCRLVWTWAVRHHRITGVKETPFKGMGLRSTAAAGTRETSRAQYNLHHATARKLGFQSMTTAAALCFEYCRRVWDAFGFEDPDGVERRGIEWAGYQPGVAISLIQSKTGNFVVLPRSIDVAGAGAGGEPGERVLLYPDLEEELARSRAVVAAGAAVIVLEERSGAKYKERRMSTIHRRICDEAGLPKDMTFTRFGMAASLRLATRARTTFARCPATRRWPSPKATTRRARKRLGEPALQGASISLR